MASGPLDYCLYSERPKSHLIHIFAVMDLTLRTLEAEYESAFARCSIPATFSARVKSISDRLLGLRSHYQTIEKATTVPWWFVGILHYQEWQFENPALFEKQVAEILIAKKYHQAKTRSLAAYLWGFDLWNGFRDGAGAKSTWVWGGTNILNGTTQRVGAAAIVSMLKQQGAIKIAPPRPSVSNTRPNGSSNASQYGPPISELMNNLASAKPVTAAPPRPTVTVQAQPKTKKLDIRYFSQRDNAGQSHRTCNTASCWMGAVYMKPSLWDQFGQDDNADLNVYLPRVNQYGDTTDHVAQTKALDSFGVRSSFRRDLSIEDVKEEIDQNRPVVLGIYHKGHVSSCGGGHMIVAVGYDETSLTIHDPYGELDVVNGDYPGSQNGAYVRYSFKNLRPRFEADGPGTGWGRVFEGKPS